MRSFQLIISVAVLCLTVPGCGGGDGGGGEAGGFTGDQLVISAFLEDSSNPAPAGVLILVNGVEVGSTNSNGQLAVSTGGATGNVTVQGIASGVAAGSALVSAGDDGDAIAVDVVLEGKGLRRSAMLEIEEAAGGVVAGTTATFTAKFVAGGTLIPATELNFVLARGASGAVQNLTESFGLTPEGRIAATDPYGVLSVFGGFTGAIELEVSAGLASTEVLNGDATFHLAIDSVTGTVAPPPSNGAVPVAGLPVTLSLIGTSILYSGVTDGAGGFGFSPVPQGSYTLATGTTFGGVTYNGLGTVFVNGSTTVTVTLASAADLLQGVVMVTSQTDGGDTLPRGVTASGRGAPGAPESVGGATISATASQQNAYMSDSESLVVPAGTTTLRLRYEVCTDEYPTYVLSQSVYNDNWDIGVYGPAGELVFYISRNVNSQIFVPPFWRADGCTGEIVEVLDVSALTGSGATFLLAGGTRNIGDSSLPTSLTATLEVASDFDVAAVLPDTGTFYMSVPRQGSWNDVERRYTATLQRPAGSTLQQITVDLLDADPGIDGLAVIGNIFEANPGLLATEVSPGLLSVRVTCGPENISGIASVPPPAQVVRYRVTATANVSGQVVSAAGISPPRIALWRMPDGFPRYGRRDPGGDDWCRGSVYLWLEANAALIPAIDDISGEHAADIGHAGHRRGTDVDIYHFTNLAGTPRIGVRNFMMLREAVVAALGGNPGGLATATSWFLAERIGLAALLADSQVIQVRAGFGAGGLGLPAGWYASLLRTGRIFEGKSTLLDLGIGDWTPPGIAGLRHDNIHNSHTHVALEGPAGF